jgi:hypothetical protein
LGTSTEPLLLQGATGGRDGQEIILETPDSETEGISHDSASGGEYTCKGNAPRYLLHGIPCQSNTLRGTWKNLQMLCPKVFIDKQQEGMIDLMIEREDGNSRDHDIV